MSTRLSPDLADLRRELEAVRDDARELTEGLSDEQLTWSPEPGRWSIVDNLEHLNVIHEGALERFERLLERGRDEGLTGEGPFRHGFLGGFMVRSMEPPVRRLRVKAPAQFSPAGDVEPRQAVERFVGLQDELAEQVGRAGGIDLRKLRMRSPANRFVKLGLHTWYAFLAAHALRHLWQARQVREAEGFPG